MIKKEKKNKKEIKDRVIKDRIIRYISTKINSYKEQLDKIIPYLGDIITDLRKSDTQKNQLIIALNFIFPKDDDKESVIHAKSNNKKFMQMILLMKFSINFFQDIKTCH